MGLVQRALNSVVGVFGVVKAIISSSRYFRYLSIYLLYSCLSEVFLTRLETRYRSNKKITGAVTRGLSKRIEVTPSCLACCGARPSPTRRGRDALKASIHTILPSTPPTIVFYLFANRKILTHKISLLTLSTRPINTISP